MFMVGIWRHWLNEFMHETLVLYYAHHVFDKMFKRKIKATIVIQMLGIVVGGLVALNKHCFKYFDTQHIGTTLHCIFALIVTHFCALFVMVCRVFVEI